jgi:hypothetical protein
MKIKINCTSGSVKNYLDKIPSKFKLEEECINSYFKEFFIELSSIEDLLELSGCLGSDLIVLKDNDVERIEIYNDYRE